MAHENFIIFLPPKHKLPVLMRKQQTVTEYRVLANNWAVLVQIARVMKTKQRSKNLNASK